ncbi:MAG: hypothetical protein H0W31_02980 [Actinobacteria bacterium]|nr:hypothetical protein [Actinomycetota bacterium]MDQ3425472.1 hypothetical protein [Actinomycetota bacterium]
MVKMTKRPAIVPDASESCGSSFVRIRKRVESLPIQSGLNFRGTDSTSSPEIDNNRSTASVESDLVFRRASEIVASGLPTSSAIPN